MMQTGTQLARTRERRDSRDDIEPLLRAPLILVAHPDDETASAVLLQRACRPTVVICTDGAPRPEYFWRDYKSREEYAQLRRDEAVHADSLVGISAPVFLRDASTGQYFADQELYRHLPEALASLSDLLLPNEVDAIVAPAYEGGHPDHDCCSLLAHLLGRRLGIPVWEMPLYYRSANDALMHQEFLRCNGTERVVRPLTGELDRRATMLAAYASQKDILDFIVSDVELYRPQPAYNYYAPPHAGRVNYEAWEWSMTALELCAAFATVLDRFADSTRDGLTAAAAASAASK